MYDDILWNGSNSSGFSAIPGGRLSIVYDQTLYDMHDLGVSDIIEFTNIFFTDIGYQGYIWTSTSGPGGYYRLCFRLMDDYNQSGLSAWPAANGMSARCVRD